ncbi:MAG: hypothetical protein AMJ54_16935 [Deltaproteobacteria bacterium SG8_13]|nr:MAG: hypothetical protein AMJ54_16935 [Deltaproteobacteria bacterium SG8_13]
MRREMDNTYAWFFRPNLFPSSQVLGEGKWDPISDIIEGKKDITFKAEIPGMEAKDFDIKEHKDKEEIYYRVERSYGYFKRTFELPAEVNPGDVDARYKRGILEIRLRKAKASEMKRIRIRTG